VLVYPLFRGRKQPAPSDPAQGRLRAERRRIYGLISDLDASRASGDVTEADYQTQLDDLRLAAAKTLQQEAAVGRTREGTDTAQLEQEIAAARQARKRPGRGRQ